MLADILPVVLFFVGFKFFGIYPATAVAVITALTQTGISYARHRKVEAVPLIGAGVLVVFGGATLLLHSEIFIKWKPTILYWIFALVIGGMRLFAGKNVVRGIFQGKIALPEKVWLTLSTAWMVFFGFLGGLNLYVAYHYPTAVWVNFKLFGLLGLLLVFIVLQSIFIAPYLKEPPASS